MRLSPRNSQLLMQKSRTLSGIMKARSNRDLTTNSQVLITIQKTRSYGSLRTKRIISLQQFGTFDRNSEENSLPLKHHYGKSSRLNQNNYGLPFKLAKIDSQTRAKESAVNFGMNPMLSEKNSREEARRLPNGCPRPPISREKFLENSLLTTSCPMVE